MVRIINSLGLMGWTFRLTVGAPRRDLIAAMGAINAIYGWSGCRCAEHGNGAPGLIASD
jgi:hypothetical protein